MTSGGDVQQSTEVCSTLPDPPIPIGRVGVPSFRSCIFHCSENRGVSARTCGTGVVRSFFVKEETGCEMRRYCQYTGERSGEGKARGEYDNLSVIDAWEEPLSRH